MTRVCARVRTLERILVRAPVPAHARVCTYALCTCVCPEARVCTRPCPCTPIRTAPSRSPPHGPGCYIESKLENLEQRSQLVYSIYFVLAKPHRPGCSPAPRRSTPRPPPPLPPASRTRIRPCRQSKSSILPSPLSLILALLLPLLVPCPLPTSVVNLIHSANQCARARACVICFLVFPPG
jgi:hypothetical protein